MKYTTSKNKIDKNVIKYKIVKPNNDILSYGEFIKLLRSENKEFLKFFRSELTGIPSRFSETEPSAYFWECVPVSQDTLNRRFEFAVVKASELDNIKQDYSNFQEHFNRSNDRDAVSFLSRSGNKLVVPVPIRGHQWSCTDRDYKLLDYKNLDKFNDNAPLEQWDKFWQKVGVEMEKSLLESNGKPCWLSTHGLNINYLHIRIDKKPDLYDFQGYKNFRVEEEAENSQTSDQDRIPTDYDLSVEKLLFENIKENIRDWSIEEVDTSLGCHWNSEQNTWIRHGKETKRVALISKNVEKKYDQLGNLVIDQGKIHYPSDFSEGKWKEIQQTYDDYQRIRKQLISDYSHLSKEQLLDLAVNLKHEINKLEAEIQKLKSVPLNLETHRQKLQDIETKKSELISNLNKINDMNSIDNSKQINKQNDGFPVVPFIGVIGLISLLMGLIICWVKKTKKRGKKIRK